MCAFAAWLHAMARDADREARLAAKLRENLRRRKAQARGMADDNGAGDASDLPKPGHES